ncbi:MAG: sigma-70 family RNA polymerase sigma factor [Lachnospiraceae bacterium]|nr:sigma-70 family RNA polymerase sigma factor [Lachnospiraceae bacterium]
MDKKDYITTVDQYANTVYRIAYSYCKHPCDAQDIAQNVFLKLLQSDTEFQDQEHIRKWLIRVAANESKNLCTSFWKKRIVPLEDSDCERSSEYSFPCQESSDLHDAVMALPYKYRIVVHLYYYEDYSIQEIAGILHRKETTIQTQLMRARKKLKTMLKENWNDEE